MKKSNRFLKAVAIAMAGVMLVGCGGSEATSGESSKTSSEGSGDVVELTFFSYLEQYQEASTKLEKLYSEVNPNVKIKFEIIGADYDKILQTRISTGDVPDIFLSGPYTLNELYSSVSYDFTDETFMSEVNSGDEYVASNGETTAIPFVSQVFGITYNKDVFEEAGVTEIPDTLSELEVACKKIEEAGFIPFAQGYKSGYVKNFMFGFPYAVDENYKENMEAMIDGEKKLEDFDFIQKIYDSQEVINKYTQDNPYNDDFAAAATRVGVGEAAMTINGNWVEENVLKANPEANLGFFAIPLSEDPADAKAYAAEAVGLHISKDGEHVEEALAFVEWLTTSQEAKDWMSQEVKTISGIKGVAPEGSGVLDDARKYIEEGNTGKWASYIWPTEPVDVGSGLSEIQDKYLLGEITREEAIAQSSEVWASISASE